MGLINIGLKEKKEMFLLMTNGPSGEEIKLGDRLERENPLLGYCYLTKEKISPRSLVRMVEGGELARDGAFWRGVETLCAQTPLRDPRTSQTESERIPREILTDLLESEELLGLYEAGRRGEERSKITDFLLQEIRKEERSRVALIDFASVQGVLQSILMPWDERLAESFLVPLYILRMRGRSPGFLRAMNKAEFSLDEKRLALGLSLLTEARSLMWRVISPRLERLSSPRLETAVSSGKERDYLLAVLRKGVYFQGWVERIAKETESLAREVFGEEREEALVVLGPALFMKTSLIKPKGKNRSFEFLEKIFWALHIRDLSGARELLIKTMKEHSHLFNKPDLRKFGVETPKE